jgi:peptidoglycan/LPS O-acetylase OafA/YrhL
MRLSALSHGRDNNFNLIRILAAFAVLITHGFALSIGTGNAEPLRKSLGVTLGTIAVDVFFITSGFLITSSLMNRKHIIYFCWARFLRIFPALWLMLIITVCGIGSMLTTVHLHEYIFNNITYRYVAYCSTLFKGVVFNLPGLFHGNPYGNAVNGSLWTLPYEVKMYSYFVMMWIAALIVENDKYRVGTFVFVLCGIYVYISLLNSKRPGHLFVMSIFAVPLNP